MKKNCGKCHHTNSMYRADSAKCWHDACSRADFEKWICTNCGNTQTTPGCGGDHEPTKTKGYEP